MSNDSRILDMRINNKEFLRGTDQSLSALQKLNKGIDSTGKGGSGMTGLAKHVDTVRTRFGALQVAGITALANITNRAVNAGINLAKSLTIAPVLDGFREYEKVLTSTQTIMANTGKSSKEVGKYLDQLNHYSDATIYNFGQMADNIGRFTAAGVKLKPATQAIKGLANSAALAGSDTNQLNTAMYQMSQALSVGTIKLMDWNSLSNAGMGGKNMRDALQQTAKSMDDNGAAMDAAIKKHGNFRESLSEGWLTADIFTKTMKVMAGRTNEAGETVAFTVEQLQKMGYSKDAAKNLHRLSAAAIESATKIKTFSQMVDVIKESLGSGWAKIFRALFGDLQEAGKMWTTVGGIITGAIDRVFDSVTAMLNEWRKLGGFQKLWGGFGNIFKAIGNVLRPFLVMFQSLTPSTNSAGQSMYNLTDAFYQFSVWLEKVTRNTSYLDPLFRAVGAAVRFVAGVVGAVIGSFIDLLKIFAPLGSELGGLVQDLYKFGKSSGAFDAIRDGVAGAFNAFVKLREAAIRPLVKTVQEIAAAIRTLVSGDMTGFKDQFRAAFSNLGAYVDLASAGKQMALDMVAGLREGWSSGEIQSSVQSFVDGFVSFFKGLLGINSPSKVFEGFGTNIVEGLSNGISGAFGLIGKAISGLFDALGGAFKNIDSVDLVSIFSTIFSGAALFVVIKFVRAITTTFSGLAGFGDQIVGPDGIFANMNDTLGAMQNTLRAKALLNIAIAVGVMAGSIWLLSKIPYKNLGVGLAALGGMMAMLVTSMSMLAKFAPTVNTAVGSLTAMSIGMIAMSIALLLLTGAVAAFGAMPTDMLVKGMIAVAAALLIFSVASLALAKAGPAMLAASVGIAILSASMIILSIGLTAMAGVMMLYEKIDMDVITDGLMKIGIVLLALSVSIAPLAAIAPMLLVASASLIVLSAGLTTMLGVILLFNKVDFGTIAGGAAKIGAALIIIGVAALVAAPGLVLLGAAALALGLGLTMAGAGITAFGIGLGLVAAAGAAAFTSLIAGIMALLGALPMMGTAFINAIDIILQVLAEKAPSMVDSLVTTGTEMLRGIRELLPEFTETAIQLTDSLLTVLEASVPRAAEAILTLIIGIMGAITQNLPQLTQKGVELIGALMQGLGSQALPLANHAAKMIVAFLNAVAIAIETHMPQIMAAGRRIGMAIVMGLVKGLVPAPVLNAFTIFVNRIVNFFKGLLGIASPSKKFLGFGRDIVMGLANGIRNTIGTAVNAISNLVTRVVNVARQLPGKIRNALSSLLGILRNTFTLAFNAARSAVTTGVSSIQRAIGRLPGIISGVARTVGSAAKKLGSSIINGIKNGLGTAINAVGNFASILSSGIKSALNSALNLPMHIPTISIKVGPKKFSVGGQQLIPAFAKGVTGFGGGAALVGEMGPEIVTMGRGSNVITNENLMKFVKVVTKFIKSTGGSRGSDVKSGGVNYIVSANFKGDPKASGFAFARNLADGLRIGLAGQQSNVDNSMVKVADSLSNAFTTKMGIQSPSKVFATYGKFLTKGLAAGMLSSITLVGKAATALGKKASAAMKHSLRKTITDSQLKLELQRGYSKAYFDAADELRAKAKATKSKKDDEKLKKRARVLDKLGKKEAKKSAAQAKKVASENAAEDWKIRYNAADNAGKAEMRLEKAQSAARAASAKRELAARLRKESQILKGQGQKGRSAEVMKQAKAAMEAAKKLGKSAEDQAKLVSELSKKAEQDALNAEAQNGTDAGGETVLTVVTDEDVARAMVDFERYMKSLMEAQDAASETRNVDVKFEQNNYSPESISAADAYRNGKSLVSIVEKKITPVL